MPLTINLLHEEQFLLKQRKRDPLKLGFYALGGVAALFLLYYAYRYAASASLHSELRDRQADWAKQEPAAKAAMTRETELSSQITAATAAGHRIEDRFYFAPVLDVVLKTVPPNVQVTNFTGTNEPKADKVSLLFEGIVAGDVPRIAADQFRVLLGDRFGKQYQGVASVFRTLDDAITSVNVGGKPKPTAHFSIEVTFYKPGVTPPDAPAADHPVKRP